MQNSCRETSQFFNVASIQFYVGERFGLSSKSIFCVSLDLNIPFIAFIAASPPASWPAHDWKHPTAFVTSPFTILTATYPAVCHRTSSIPIGCNPGFLSRGTSLQVKNATSSVSSLVLSIGRISLHIFWHWHWQTLFKSALIVL